MQIILDTRSCNFGIVAGGQSAAERDRKRLFPLLHPKSRERDEDAEAKAAELLKAADARNSDRVAQLLADGHVDRTAALVVAADRGKASVQSMVDAGVAINFVDKDKFTALMLAAARLDVPVMETLLSFNPMIDAVAKRGESALLLALRHHAPGDAEAKTRVVRLLLEHGANIREPDARAALALGDFWHRLVEQDESRDAVSAVALQAPELCDYKDRRGHTADAMMSEQVKKAWNEATHFCGCIELASNRDHKSKTCVILRGRVTTAVGDLDEGDEVVVKLMKEEVHFDREIDMRDGLGEDSVVTIATSSKDKQLRDRWAVDAGKRGYADYPRGIVMKAAQRNLMVILVQEHLVFEKLVDMVREVARCLGMMHANGKVHADFKPLNCVRMTDGSYRLINLDTSVRIGQPAGEKMSTAFCPPEMTLERDGHVHFKSQTLAKARHSSGDSSNGKEKEKSYDNNDDEIADDSYNAEPSFDLWSLGCVCFRAFTRSSLFEADDADNLRPREQKRLHGWCAADVAIALREVDASLRDMASVSHEQRALACDLVGWLLQPDPIKRPRSATELRSHALFVAPHGYCKLARGLSCTADDGGDEEDDASDGKFSDRAKTMMSALHWAAAVGTLEIEGLLAKGGTDVSLTSTQHALAQTPLHVAALATQHDMSHCAVSAMLCATKRGGGSGEGAKSVSSERDHPSSRRRLTIDSGGADPNAIGACGDTAIHGASCAPAAAAAAMVPL